MQIIRSVSISPHQILIENKVIVFRTLKKRKPDRHGNPKDPEYKRVEVPERLIENLDLAFDLKRFQNSDALLWSQSRTTAWRLIKRVLDRAGIKGPQASPKGFRHSFGIAMAQTGMPLTVLKELLRHASTSTTEVYLNFVGDEKRTLVMKGWQ
jgi:integrase